MDNNRTVLDMKDGMVVSHNKGKSTFSVRISEANYTKASELAKLESEKTGTYVSTTSIINRAIANYSGNS